MPDALTEDEMREAGLHPEQSAARPQPPPNRVTRDGSVPSIPHIPPPPAPRARHNHLPRADQRRLEDWLEAQWEAVQRQNLTQRQAARRATVCLGLHITMGNVRGAVRALGKTWPPSALAATYLVNQAVRADLRTVAHRLAQLYGRIGQEVPGDLAQLAKPVEERDEGRGTGDEGRGANDEGP